MAPLTGITETAAVIGNFLFGTEIGEGQLKKPPVNKIGAGRPSFNE